VQVDFDQPHRFISEATSQMNIRGRDYMSRPEYVHQYILRFENCSFSFSFFPLSFLSLPVPFFLLS
jgi:hypothetical protein